VTTNFRQFGVDEILSDGSPIRVRAIRPDDGERLQEYSQSLSKAGPLRARARRIGWGAFRRVGRRAPGRNLTDRRS